MDPIRVRLSIVPGRVHNLFNEIVELPPPGIFYSFPAEGDVGYKPPPGGKPPLAQRIQASPAFKRAYGPVLRNVLGGVGLRERLRRGAREYDVYHSVGGVHPNAEPWVVNFESSLDLFSFGADWHEEIRKPSSRAYVARKLRSRHCARLLPETDAARRSLLTTFPDAARELDEKMEVVQIALRPGREPRPEPEGSLRLLFVGSRNFPKDFVPKGGHLVLAAFAKLRERIPDATLTVRSVVPEPYASRYRHQPGLTILDGELTKEKLDTLYEDHHVFVFPGSSTPGMVIREAMRAARPTVTIDVWANREVVLDGETGFVVAPPEAPYTNAHGALNWSHDRSFLDPFETNVDKAVAAITDALEQLARDRDLRRRMGQAARRAIVSGHLSIPVRNEKLRRAYEIAARR